MSLDVHGMEESCTPEAPKWFRTWEGNHFHTLSTKVDKLVIECAVNRKLAYLTLAAIFGGYAIGFLR